MCIMQEIVELWIEKERCGSQVIPRLLTKISDVKVRDDDKLLSR